MQSYNDYLESNAWKEVKLRYKSSGLPWYCRICKAKQGINLHHREYKNDLSEVDIKKDLVALCYVCHANVHWDNKLGKTPLERKYLVQRENQLYREYNGIFSKIGRFRLGSFINWLYRSSHD